jgi:hypothetical protein
VADDDDDDNNDHDDDDDDNDDDYSPKSTTFVFSLKGTQIKLF